MPKDQTSPFMVYMLLAMDSGAIHRIGTGHCEQKSWWRHQMDTFSALLALCAGESTDHRWVTLTKGQWYRPRCFLWCEPIQTLHNSRVASDLRRQGHGITYIERCHYFGTQHHIASQLIKSPHVSLCHGTVFLITGRMWGESTGYRWIISRGPVCWALMFSLLLANHWTKSRVAGDLRRHDTHVTSL